MASRLAGKKVLITGAAAGMGRAGVLLFAGEGAKVVAVDRDASALETLGAEASGIETITADLSVPGIVEDVVREAAQRLGGLDALWNHAGITGPASIESMAAGSYDATVWLNLTVPVHACAMAAPIMRAQGGGSIVITSSVAGMVGSLQSAVYSATKHAVVGLARSLALQFASSGIRVNALCPGPVRTQMMEDMRLGRIHPEGAAVVDRLIASVPLARLAEPIEIAEAALWLASDASSYVTGIALLADGGMTAM